LYNIEWKC